MGGRAIATLELKDGRRAEFGYVVASDAPAMLAYVEVVAAETDYLTFGPGEFDMTLAQQVEFIESMADRTKGLNMKATVGGVLVGHAMVRRSTRPRVRHVGELGLSVQRSFWGGGIGRALCGVLFAEAKSVGIERIGLTVCTGNLRAIRLYESLGFVREGQRADVLRVGAVSHDELLMGLRL
jgi:RimJ/RimL family protein N-acetyltransferase